MTDEPKNVPLERAQRQFLDKVAPGATTRLAAWSGGRTQLIEMGEGDPVLFVHGGLGDAFQWAPLMARLPRNRRLIAAISF